MIPPSPTLSHHILIPLAGSCSDDDNEYDEGPTISMSFPSFWPPFTTLLSNFNSDVPFPPHMDRPAPQGTASAFFELGFHEEDDEDANWVPPDEEGGEVGLPLCWDCLQPEDHDHKRWNFGMNDGDEWEQVAVREDGEDAAASGAVRSLKWEVLLAANSLGNLVVDDADDDRAIDTFFLDHPDDVLFRQLATEADHEPPMKSSWAAAKATMEGLPTVVVAAADVARGDTQCAMCKDVIEAEERARSLPFAHLYHDGCILPWPAICNTCPLCRHELLTDDADYER